MLDDVYALRDKAEAQARRGDLEGATTTLLQALQYTHIPDHDYSAVLEPLWRLFERQGKLRQAISVEWYLASTRPDPGKNLWNLLARPQLPPVDRARSLAFLKDMPGAARAMEEGGLVAAAAIYQEGAGSFVDARALWARLARERRIQGDAYCTALVQFNLARCARLCGDASQFREATVAAVGLLEEAADHFESVGQRERAFDCFQVLIRIGRDSGVFEHALEGYVNAIRILREDHLKYYAIHYFDEAIRAARDHKEFAAAATLCREASEYARNLGLPQAGTHYLLEQADLWQSLARWNQERGIPPEMTENALLAAVLAYGEAGQFAKVAQTYRALSTMDLDTRRRHHYERAAQRYDGAADELLSTQGSAPRVHGDAGYPDVWHVDVLEWEQGGSASEATADVLLRPGPDLVRRKALVARLSALACEEADPVRGPTEAQRIHLVEHLAPLQTYSMLSPLERLYATGDKLVRLAVLGALKNFFFKRTFVTLRTALRDPDPAVVEKAARAVEGLDFVHAFDALQRILRETNVPAAKTSALVAMAHIDTLDAAEFLVTLLDSGSPEERAAAMQALRQTRGLRFGEVARQALPTLGPDGRRCVAEVLQARRDA